MRYKLCKKCRAMVRKATREALQQKKEAGVKIGRPRKQLSASVLKKVLSGELTPTEAAALFRVTPTTVRRRVKEARGTYPA